MFTANLYAAGEAAAEQPSMFASFLPLIIIFVLFYFLFIAPQRKEQKKHAEMLKALAPGDKIVTRGGIVGTVNKLNEKDETIQIRTGENTVINVSRPYVAAKIEKNAVEQPKSTEKK
ncbi:MAG: preprotein translocase subunit YajC [Candidatus Goldiibacteriota bacterium]